MALSELSNYGLPSNVRVGHKRLSAMSTCELIGYSCKNVYGLCYGQLYFLGELLSAMRPSYKTKWSAHIWAGRIILYDTDLKAIDEIVLTS